MDVTTYDSGALSDVGHFALGNWNDSSMEQLLNREDEIVEIKSLKASEKNLPTLLYNKFFLIKNIYLLFINK